MNSIVYRTHLGRLLCPKPRFFNYFQGISRFSGKLVGPWDNPCVFPTALRDPVARFPLFGVYDGVISRFQDSKSPRLQDSRIPRNENQRREPESAQDPNLGSGPKKQQKQLGRAGSGVGAPQVIPDIVLIVWSGKMFNLLEELFA